MRQQEVNYLYIVTAFSSDLVAILTESLLLKICQFFHETIDRENDKKSKNKDI